MPLAPDKRPYHTIIPGMATRGDQMWLSFGVMGGFQQPQGQLQVMANMVDFDLEPQEALDALRFSALIGDGVAVEEEVNGGTREELIRRGHHIVTYGDENRSLFGGGQIIERDAETGCAEGWVGASEGWVCYWVVGGRPLGRLRLGGLPPHWICGSVSGSLAPTSRPGVKWCPPAHPVY